MNSKKITLIIVGLLLSKNIYTCYTELNEYENLLNYYNLPCNPDAINQKQDNYRYEQQGIKIIEALMKNHAAIDKEQFSIYRYHKKNGWHSLPLPEAEKSFRRAHELTKEGLFTNPPKNYGLKNQLIINNFKTFMNNDDLPISWQQLKKRIEYICKVLEKNPNDGPIVGKIQSDYESLLAVQISIENIACQKKISPEKIFDATLALVKSNRQELKEALQTFDQKKLFKALEKPIQLSSQEIIQKNMAQ